MNDSRISPSKGCTVQAQGYGRLSRSLTIGAARRLEREKTMNKTDKTDLLQALAALDSESQAKILASIKKDALVAALGKAREKEAAERAEKEKRLRDNMDQIGKLLDKVGVSGRIVFEKNETGWNYSLREKMAHQQRKLSSSPRNLVLNDDIRNIIKNAVEKNIEPRRDPERCKPSGACEVYIFSYGDREVKIPASVLGFWAIERGARNEKDIQKYFPFLTGGQCRGSLLRYDSALETGQIVKG